MTTVQMKWVKTTTNFHKFESLAPFLGSIYIPKDQMPTPPPVINLPVQTT